MGREAKPTESLRVTNFHGRSLVSYGFNCRGRRDAGSAMEVPFWGKNPQLKRSKAGVRHPRLATAQVLEIQT